MKILQNITFIFLCGLINFICCSASLAQESMTMTTYYPPPVGTYNKLKLVAFTPPSCATANDVGTIYYDSADNALRLCTDDAGTIEWNDIGGSGSSTNIWDRDGTNGYVFLRNPADHVGIGNSAPPFKLTIGTGLASDAGILTIGVNSGGALPSGLGGPRFMWAPDYAAIRAGAINDVEWDPINVGYSSTAFGYGNIASGQSSSALGGEFNTASGWAATVNGRSNVSSGIFSTVSGGGFNQATAIQATVSGGVLNEAVGDRATVGGGYDNTAGDPVSPSPDSRYATVAGGSTNLADRWGATVRGGTRNIAGGGGAANGWGPTVAGGIFNQAFAPLSFVGGGGGPGAGCGNATLTANAVAAVIGGGIGNRATGRYSVIGGGGGVNGACDASLTADIHNTASGDHSTISGGGNNTASGIYSSIGGGGGPTVVFVSGPNSVTADYSRISGGTINSIAGVQSSIGGGYANMVSALANSATISGGFGHQLDGWTAYTGGGFFNRIVGAGTSSATISGGHDNIVNNSVAGTILGGYFNQATGFVAAIYGGTNNQANGGYAAVSGESNISAGDRTWIGGRFVTLTAVATDTFVWGTGNVIVNPEVPITINEANRFLIFPDTFAGNGAPGRVGIGYNSPQATLDVDGNVIFRVLPATAAGTTLVVDAAGMIYRLSSSKRYKENIRHLSTNSDQILKLNPVQFNIKGSSQESIGLVAEDVAKVIPDLVINDAEGRPDAVQYAKLALYLLEGAKELKAENAVLKQRIEALEQK